MFPIISVSRAAAGIVKTEVSRRGVARFTDIVVSAPQTRISFAEKMVHMGLLFAGIIAYPIYTMFHVAAIKQAEYDNLEIPQQWQEWEEKK